MNVCSPHNEKNKRIVKEKIELPKVFSDHNLFKMKGKIHIFFGKGDSLKNGISSIDKSI